jgi:hypothetical protein
MKNKKGVEMNFAFIFSLIVGGVILFLAIYFAVSVTRTGGEVTSSFEANRFVISLQPYELAIASGSSEKVDFEENILIENYCSSWEFGSQEITLSKKPLSRGKLQRGVPIPVTNKYVFSNIAEEGSLFQVLVQPVEIPFKVSEIIIISSNEYCFQNTPQKIKNEVSMLNLGNVKIQEDEECLGDEISVCFVGSGENCNEENIIVKDLCTGSECDDFEYGKVTKKNSYGHEQELYYYDNLIYGAIFSDTEVYNCNVKRILYRARTLAKLYSEQSNLVRINGCGSVNVASLAGYLRGVENLTGDNIYLFVEEIKSLERAHNAAGCKLW